jgi:hypothetical protein
MRDLGASDGAVKLGRRAPAAAGMPRAASSAPKPAA